MPLNKVMRLLFFAILIHLLPLNGVANTNTDTIKSGSTKTTAPGVYITAHDFATGQKALVDSNTQGKQKIKKHYIFNRDYIDVVLGETQVRYHKDSIYAYEDNDGSVYRFYGENHDEYKILEAGAIILYMTEERDFASKHYKPVISYFFSTGYNSKIIPLSLKNIKTAFPDDFILHHYLDMEFISKEIHAYDEAKKMHLINYLISKYKQN